MDEFYTSGDHCRRRHRLRQVDPSSAVPARGRLLEHRLHSAAEDRVHLARQEGGLRDAERARHRDRLPDPVRADEDGQDQGAVSHRGTAAKTGTFTTFSFDYDPVPIIFACKFVLEFFPYLQS